MLSAETEYSAESQLFCKEQNSRIQNSTYPIVQICHYLVLAEYSVRYYAEYFGRNRFRSDSTTMVTLDILLITHAIRSYEIPPQRGRLTYLTVKRMSGVRSAVNPEQMSNGAQIGLQSAAAQSPLQTELRRIFFLGGGLLNL